jgi:DNA-binding transcriptional LysR family regulator
VNLDRHVSLKQLRAFVAVCRLQTLSAAAEQLAVTPGAVSVLLKQLESALDAPLFDRAAGRLRPTAAALDALPTAERILADVSLLGRDVREWQEHRRGSVRLAVTPGVGLALLPPLMRRFVQAYPGIRVVVDDCAPEHFVDRLLSEQAELGIGTPERGGTGLTLQPLVTDRLCVVCPAGHPFAGQRTVRWTQLREQPLILIRAGYGVRGLIERTAARTGLELQVVNDVAFLATALWMVSCGLGLSVLPAALVATPADPQLVVRPLTHPTVHRGIALVRKRGRLLSPACEQFAAMVQEVMGEG